MTKSFRILTVIPKINATKIAVFHDDKCIYKHTIDHIRSFIDDESFLEEDIDYRKNEIINQLLEAGINMSKLNAVSAIGGMLKPIEGGTYIVTEKMLNDLKRNYSGKHISNLGAIIAKKIASGLNIEAYIVDPPVVNEFIDEATYTGVPSIKRKSIFHALNQKAVARQAAGELNCSYNQVNLIVAHLGFGITIGAHKQGKVIDVNNGLHGDGPFSIERAGTLPLNSLISLCYSKKYNEEELIDKLSFKSGLKAYLRTDDLDSILRQIADSKDEIEPIIKALTYQIAKEIGSMAAVLNGHIDGIVLTGHLAKIERIIDLITEKVSWISDIFVYPGEYDLQAINEGTLRVLRNKEEAKVYT